VVQFGFHRIVRIRRGAHTLMSSREREPDMPTAAAEQEEVQRTALNQEATPPKEAVCANAQVLDDIEQIYAMYNARVYYLCLRMTGNADDAEDLSQEAFLRLIQKLDTFRGESAFYTWLRRLAINLVLLRFQKASWRREVSLEGLTEPDSVFACRPAREFGTVDLEVKGAIDRINLERAIDRLPPGFKAVFVLHDIEGYEHIEISRLLGCSIGTSKSQLHKARLRMREFLSQTWQGKEPEEGLESGLGSDPKPTSPHTKDQPILQFTRPSPFEYDKPLSRTA
jgi:RNA polymerase sigma-70 factor, ECF subfamily